MRTTSALVLVIVTLTAAPPAAAGPLTANDRRRLIEHFEMTESWLVSEVQGLSDAQLKFRPATNKWHIMDVVEHLAISEPNYWRRVQDSMKQPPSTQKPRETDADILWYGIDRERAQVTGPEHVPKGKFPTVQASLASFRKLRSEMLRYARTTQEDMRARWLMGGDMDVYQWLLMISTHSQRHILQIREIKGHASYPGMKRAP